MYTLDQYIDYYERNNYLIDRQYVNKNKTLTNRQLKKKYDKYVANTEKEPKIYKPDYYDEWIICREKVYQRDHFKCRLYSILSKEEKLLAKKHGLIKYITPAHFISRHKNKNLICCVDNVYTLYYTFHNNLDSCKDPITGKSISKEKVLKYWIRIIGDLKLVEYLQNYKEKV